MDLPGLCQSLKLNYKIEWPHEDPRSSQCFGSDSAEDGCYLIRAWWCPSLQLSWLSPVDLREQFQSAVVEDCNGFLGFRRQPLLVRVESERKAIKKEEEEAEGVDEEEGRDYRWFPCICVVGDGQRYGVTRIRCRHHLAMV
jgi:hypothetical protein